MKQHRGFAAMDPQKRREIAANGGRKAQQLGKAHRWTTGEAIAAGRKGGLNSNGGKGKDESGAC
jgi:uncharacterized protein